MKLWISGEIQADIYDAFSISRKDIENAVNQKLAAYSFETSFEKWAFIPIIRKEDHPDYPEITRKDTRRKVLEFRHKISYHTFLNASQEERNKLILVALRRTLTLMPGMGVSSNDCKLLEEIIVKLLGEK